MQKKFKLDDVRFDEVMEEIYKLMMFREGLPSEGAIKDILERVIWEEIVKYTDVD